MSSFSKTLAGYDLETEVGKALDVLTGTDAEFTAYEVTQKVRYSVGPAVEVVHNDVRNLVHRLMNVVVDYEQFNKDFNGTPVLAYRPKQKKAAHSLNLKLTGSLSVTDPNATYMYPKTEGRVTVPASALKQIGVKPSDNVWLTKNKDLLTISKVTGHTQYVADKYGSIRLRNKYVQGCKRFKLVVAPTYVQLVGER